MLEIIRSAQAFFTVTGRTVFFWALAGSLGLHALIAYSFWPRPPLRPASPPRIVVHAQILAPIEPARAATPEPTPLQEAPPAPAAALAPPPAPRQAPLAAAPPPTPSASAPTDMDGYLSIDEVDTPATPEGDWRIDTEVLPLGYTLRLVILVWISATGNVDKWELDSQSGNKSYALKALADLDRTALHPAMRNNIAVPSYRRLEIVISHD